MFLVVLNDAFSLFLLILALNLFWFYLVGKFVRTSMLLPTNSSAPIGFQQDYYELPEKTKYLTTRCVSSSRNSKSPVREKSYDTLKRNRFRFCVCTGPRRSKKSTKWYVKVRRV